MFFDGDQLTGKQARNAQLIFRDGDNQIDRLEDLQPAHADWHAKKNLYEAWDYKIKFHPELIFYCFR